MFLLFPLPQILVPLKCRNWRFFLPKVRTEATRNGLIVIWLTSHLCANSTPPHTHPPRSQQEKQVRKTRQTYVNAKTLSRRKRNCKWPWVQKEPLRSASNILRLLKNWMYKYQNKTKILKSNLLAVKASSFIWQGPAVEFGAGTSPKVVPMVQVWIGQRNLGSPPQVYAARKLGISKKETKTKK